MAFGHTLNSDDSATVRAILKDPTVTAVTFYPRDEGYALFGEIAYQCADEIMPSIQRDDPRFQPLMDVVSALGYPHEFNDKFFVDLEPQPVLKTGTTMSFRAEVTGDPAERALLHAVGTTDEPLSMAESNILSDAARLLVKYPSLGTAFADILSRS